MDCRSSTDFRQKSFRLKHEDEKFFTRFLSKESSKSNPSFRVYYGDVPSAVPFTWETIPGTPKHKSSDNSHLLPPLTPPPSYHTKNLNNSSKNHSRSKLLFRNLLNRMNPAKKSKNFESPSDSSSSSLSSLSWSSPAHSSFSDPVTTPGPVRKRRRFSSWGSSSDAKAVDNSRRGEVRCFGIGKDNGEGNKGGGYSVSIVKKALLSIVGRGSAA